MRIFGRGRQAARGARFALATALILGTLSTGSVAREVTVRNDIDEPIYKLFAWPSELVPRTYSILSTPLMPNTERTITVEDVYGDCVYTFQAELTGPKTRRKPKFREYKKPRPRSLFIYNMNLCLTKRPVEFK